MHRQQRPVDHAEGILRRDGAGRFDAFSAGSRPTGAVNPYALTTLHGFGYPTEGFDSRSRDQFAAPGAPQIDFVFTVCDNAAGEACPVWPVWPVWRADHSPAGDYRHARCADPDPGLFQRRTRLRAQPRRWRGTLRRRSVRADRRQQFFRTAVAAAISLFGFDSGAALATVVGVLIEAPVMLSVVWIVNGGKHWYERGAGRSAASETT